MLNQQVILISSATTNNVKVSTTRINTPKVTFKSRLSNVGKVRIGFPSFNYSTEIFTDPTDPLTDSTSNTIVLDPGESFTPPPESGSVELGEWLDLSRIWVQRATATDKVEVIYEQRMDK